MFNALWHNTDAETQRLRRDRAASTLLSINFMIDLRKRRAQTCQRRRMNPHLLIVDDEISNTILLKQILNKGFSVSTSENGLDAMSAAFSKRPSLVITDINMPVMDGLEFIRNFRKNYIGRLIPVIATCANLDNGDSALKLGADGFIKKPIAIDQLFKCINDISKNKIKLLLVDDDEDFLNYLKERLQSAFIVKIATDGEKALEIFEKEPIHILVTDLMMPQMDGIHLINVVHSKDPTLPIITLSGFDSERLLEAVQSGAENVLEKPFQMAELERMLRSVMRKYYSFFCCYI